MFYFRHTLAGPQRGFADPGQNDIWGPYDFNIGSPKIGVESFILMIEHILVSILFNLTRATCCHYVIVSTLL